MGHGHHHPEPHEPSGLGGYVRQFFTNWGESDAPIARKLWLTARNRTLALGRDWCCGHPGEPGC